MRMALRLKKSSNGKRHNQGRCRCKDCKNQLAFVCSLYMHDSDPDQKQYWFCNPTTHKGSKCFAMHIREAHGEGGS